MKKKPQDQRDWHERRIEEARKTHAATAVSSSPKTSPTHPDRFSQAGLANEPRPGLGSRPDDPKLEPPPEETSSTTSTKKQGKSSSKPKATVRGYVEPPPAPREQASDSRAHDEERSTGVSGHSGAT